MCEKSGRGRPGRAVDYVIKILIYTNFIFFKFNSFPRWVFRTSFLIKQINGFNKHALNSSKSKLYNIYTFENIYIILKVLQLAIILITLNPFT